MFAPVQYVPMITLIPRFIMGLRELAARDVQGSCGGGIDSGFGLSSSNGNAGTAFAFAEVVQNEE